MPVLPHCVANLGILDYVVNIFNTIIIIAMVKILKRLEGKEKSLRRGVVLTLSNKVFLQLSNAKKQLKLMTK